MKFFLFLIRESKLTFALAVLAGAVGGTATAGLLAVINEILNSEQAAVGDRMFWTYVGLVLLVPVARIGSRFILARYGEGVGFRLRVDLTRRILDSPLRNLESLGSPRLMAALVSDIGSITNALGMIPLFSVNASIVLGCLLYLGWLSWPLMIGFVVFIAFGILSYRMPQLIGLKLFREVREEQDTLYKQYEGLTKGAKELKIHRERGLRFLGEVEGTSGVLRRLNVSAATVFAAATASGELILFIALGLMLFMAPGWLGVERQVLSGYTLLILYMTNPLQFLLNSVPMLDRANVSVRKLRQLELTDATGDLAPRTVATVPEPPSWGRVELVGARYTYVHADTERDFAVGPVSLVFEPGELVIIAGGNGSGKTTFAKVLCGLYDLEEGELQLDGRPITEALRPWYWQHFSVVFSDFYLFDSLLGLEGPELDRQARFYLEKLQLHHKVRVEEGALSTTELSQGQRKRLALLTAYLEDRPVYIFDEWAADQDPVFKDVFYRTILPDLKARKKTLFVISHDDRYYDVADRVIKLVDGRVELDARPSEAARQVGVWQLDGQ